MKVNSTIRTSQFCWICQKPHAKRKCPANNGYICSLCCGSKRKREIRCPDDCQYLIEGKNRWIKKLQITQTQIDFWRNHFDVVHNIEFATLKVKRTQLSDLKNTEIQEAIENLIKTYETEERGIIYEYKSSNYRVQTIIDNIHHIINQHRHITSTQDIRSQSIEKRLRKVPLYEIITCLKFVLGLVKQSIFKNITDTGYSDFIGHFTSNTLIYETL